MSETKNQLAQCFGRKKNSVAVASVRSGKGVLRVNGSPIELLEPQSLRAKVLEPILLLGLKRFQNLDIRIRVRGGGYVSQIYAIRQALSKGVVAYYQKYVNETEKREIKGTYASIQNFCCNTIDLSLSLTLVDASPRNTEDLEPELDTRNPIDDLCTYLTSSLIPYHSMLTEGDGCTGEGVLGFVGGEGRDYI
jgi:small subunit ribosomal protein S16e